MKRTLIAVLALLGCGLPENPNETVDHEQSSITVAHPTPVRTVPRDVLTLHERAPAPEALGVTLSGLPQEGHLFASVGQLSCGFWGIGKADASITGGAVTLNIPLDSQVPGSWSLFFFIDADGDGQCTTETVYSTHVDVPATGLQLDTSTLQPSYAGGCWAF
jgi:hypothetical protein